MTDETRKKIEAAWEGYCAASQPIGYLEGGVEEFCIDAMDSAAYELKEAALAALSTISPAPDPVAEAARMKNLIDSIVFAHNGLQRMCDRAWAGEIETCPREFSRSIWGAFEDIKRSLPTELTAHWDETLKKIKLNMAREGKDLPSIYDKASDVAEADALKLFTEYFCKNYPGPDTIIHDPNWHAPRLFRAALRALTKGGE